jgi:hypothetical protein
MNVKLHEAPHIFGQLYVVPHGILRVFIIRLHENVRMPELFQLLPLPGGPVFEEETENYYNLLTTFCQK